MMKVLLDILLILSLNGVCCVALAAEQVIYQWRDSNNVLHVSQLPPTDVEYQTIIIGAQKKSAVAMKKPETSEKASTDDVQSCLKARENLRILQQDLPVYIDLEDGSKKLLDDSKRSEQQQLAEKQINLYCDKPAT